MKNGVFKPTNHLQAEADEDWLAFYMRGTFCNSHRIDLPTREVLTYFAPTDEYETREQPKPHTVDLKGFDQEQGQRTGWVRTTFPERLGFMVRDLNHFVWRNEEHHDRCELRATRITNHRWAIEFLGQGVVEQPLAAFFRMIDPATLKIVKCDHLLRVTLIAATASRIVTSDNMIAFHPEPFRLLERAAKAADINVSSGYSWCPRWEEPLRAEIPKWWKMLLALPETEEMPTFREGESFHLWRIKHADIMFERYKESMPQMIAHGTNGVPAEQLLRELTCIAKVLHRYFGKPPTFSLRPYLWGIREHQQNEVLHQASLELGWKVS